VRQAGSDWGGLGQIGRPDLDLRLHCPAQGDGPRRADQQQIVALAQALFGDGAPQVRATLR
jgi:hypothetical protein